VDDNGLIDGGLPLALETPSGPRTLADRVFIVLRNAIMAAQLEPGQLLRLDEVAQRLGVSVMPVRDALRRLAAAGLVEFAPHRVASVATISEREVMELFHLRLAIEVSAIRRAAPHFTDLDAVLAQAATKQYEAALIEGNLASATECHQKFHLALYRAESQPWLVRTVMPLWEAYGRYWNWLDARKAWSPQDRRRSHELLLQRCLENDAEGAAAELTTHLSFGQDVLMQTLSERLPEMSSV
jgi:DNA-binding GntR family transcriptional regulator